MSSIEQANQEIEEEILKEWDTWTRPLLISKLGSILSSETKHILAETGYGLKRYILENLEDRVRLVPMSGRGGGVAPLEKTLGYTDIELEDLYDKRPTAIMGVSPVPMYWGDVWRGFQAELAESSVRYIIFGASGRPEVIDAPEGAGLPTNAKLIEPSDLVLSNPGEPRPPRPTVHRAIENWSRREGIPLASLEFHPQHSGRAIDTHRRLAVSSISNRAGVASLMQGIDLLSRDELARINIPADLVLAMLQRSGSR